MPCTFQSHDYRCDLGFSESELESRERCVLHVSATPESLATSRLPAIQAALDAVLQRFSKKDRELRLVATVLPEGISFANRKLPSLRFEHAHFGGGESFRGIAFQSSVTFVGCRFHKSIDFAEASFDNDLSLSGAFEGCLNLSRCHFRKDASLELSAEGRKPSLILREVSCDGSLSFRQSGTFSGTFELQNSKIRGELRVHGEFEGAIDISECRVEGLTCVSGRAARDFRATGCVFGADADIRDMKFNRTVNFARAEFFKRARFRGATFSSPALLSDCTFWSDVDFSAGASQSTEERSLQEISFEGSKFRSDVRFTNRVFASTTNFARCTFARAPEFHGAQLHQDTRFPLIDAFTHRQGQNAAAAYRTLRQAMERNNARREEAIFYALEQKTLRNLHGAQTGWENFSSWFYDKVSSYGVNFWRPLGLLLLCTVAFGFIYALLRNWPVVIPSQLDLRQVGVGITFSIQQVVSPFGVWRVGIPWKTVWPDVVKLVATLQSIITTGLFTLFILALRWRFKRD
jgi:hypothetical protein